MINLGDKVKDKISGLIGIVVGRSEYLHGCVRVGIAPIKPTGKADDWQWFDEPQLALMNRSVFERTFQATGGPRPNPKR